MSLAKEIDKAKMSVNTDSVQITIGEIANMYENGELDILPEFQRLFRWSIEKKSNFVESILVGIPIPPAFAYENTDGTWELVDGLQRISTILEFMGLLIDPDTENPRRSKLVDTKYLPSLNGVVWEKKHNDEKELDKSFQLFFRRHRIDFQVLKHPSDSKTKFDLFQRLNRGGAYANEQEVRTCSMVLADPNFTKSLRKLAAESSTRQIFRISDDQVKSQKDIEYLVRLIVHTFKDFEKGTDVQEFLDKSIIDVMSSESGKNAVKRARWTINTLFSARGEDALIPTDDRVEGIAQRFSLRALEGIAVGIARNRKSIGKLSDPNKFVRERIEDFWKQDEVGEMSGSGLRGTVRLQKTVNFGDNFFAP